MIAHRKKRIALLLFLIIILAALPANSTTLLNPATFQKTDTLKLLSTLIHLNTTNTSDENTTNNPNNPNNSMNNTHVPGNTNNHTLKTSQNNSQQKNNTQNTNNNTSNHTKANSNPHKTILQNININTAPKNTSIQSTIQHTTSLQANTTNIHTTFHITHAEKGSVQIEELENKPQSTKNPHFVAMNYFEIHADNLTCTNITIRVKNKWQRSDLTIYHYTGTWEELKTATNGEYLEATTPSLSVFAVGAAGGINVHLTPDTTVLTDDTITLTGAAYYNNHTAAASINIEINPEWTTFANTTTDNNGNFIKILTSPQSTGNNTLWINATDSSLNGSNTTTITTTNTTLYKTTAHFSIANTTTTTPYKNISFNFPPGAVAESSNITLTLGTSTSLEVKANNITVYSATTNNANINLTGYITTQNDINITTGTSTSLTYNLTTSFHQTQTAPITRLSTYYSANLTLTNDMSYDWNNTNITYHLPSGASNVTTWENTTNLTGNSITKGQLLRLNSIGVIYNNSHRQFYANHSLKELNLSITISKEEVEKNEETIITPTVYYNDSQIAASALVRIYRDSTLVHEENVTSGNSITFSNNTPGMYNITVASSSNIDGVERSGTTNNYLHIKDLLIYLITNTTLSEKPINITGRAYYTNCTGCTGVVNLSMDGGSWNTTTNTTGYFNYSLPGKPAGTYTITANMSSGNYTANTNATVDVLDDYFYLITGYLPVTSGEKTLNPNATIWANNTNITRASLHVYGKTTANLTYDPFPYPIIHKLIPTNYGSNVSGTFSIPIYPYDYLEILTAHLNTTAEIKDAGNSGDMAFNLTIDGRQINSTIITGGASPLDQSDSITGYIPDLLRPGQTQTIKVYNKNIDSTQQYYFTEKINITYIGHVSAPHDLHLKVNNNFTHAKVGDFTNQTMDITGFTSPNNSILITNNRTSVIGYNLSLQKRYSGHTTHNINEQTSRYNITDNVTFTPEANLTSAIILIPLTSHARDVEVIVNGANYTATATINENMELRLPEINSTMLINLSYWAPILDITPHLNNTQFNRADTVQISADVTHNGANTSDAIVYANITKDNTAITNLTLNHSYGGHYTTNYTIDSSAALGIYNISIWAYNASTAKDNETTSYTIRALAVTSSAGGPYTVDTNASITGYVKDLENSSAINNATVNIKIWNASFNYDTNVTTNSTGYYSLSREVDLAGNYNITVNATDSNILGNTSTNYQVKYNVSVSTSQESYNKNSSVPVNITIYDKELLPVPGVTINSSVEINSAYTYYNSTTDASGGYNYTHTTTNTLGQYNITVDASKSGVIGNATDTFHISNLTITANTQTDYQVNDIVTINGTVYDDESGEYVTGATVNITVNNGTTDVATNSTTTSAGNYTILFTGLAANPYTASVDVTYTTLTGGASTAYQIHYDVNTTINKSIYSIGEAVPINITVFDVSNTPAITNISVNITKPDLSIETINGASGTLGYFNTSFTNTSLDGDYNISVHAKNASAHGDATNRSFRATGFIVNASLDRTPGLYKPYETINISGYLVDTIGDPRTSDVTIHINDSTNSEITNTTLSNQHGSYLWNYTLAKSAVAGWYTITINATTPEGATNSTTTNFETQLNITLSPTQPHYNPLDTVNITILTRNGTTPEDATPNVTVQKLELWNQFTGDYFNESKTNQTTPAMDTGYYLNVTQNNELLIHTTNLTPASTWVGRAVRLNTTLPDRFLLNYEVSTSGTASRLLATTSLGNNTEYAELEYLNYSDDTQDSYSVNISGTRYTKNQSTNDVRTKFSLEYDSGLLRFYKEGKQFYQQAYTPPADAFIKLNGYAYDDTTGKTAYIKFDNLTLYNKSATVLDQGVPVGSGGNYTFNFTAGTIGMYQVNTTIGNSTNHTIILVRSLNITSTLYGPYNFNETNLSNNTIVPILVQGTVQDTETQANITGAEVNITILRNGNLHTYNVTTTNNGTYLHNFSQDFNYTATGRFNITINVNDSSILATHNTSFDAYTTNQSWFEPYMDYRVPILLYNNNATANSGTVTFNLELPGGYSGSTAGIYDIEGNQQAASIVDLGSYVNVTFIKTLSSHEGKILYLYFDRPYPEAPNTTSMTSLNAPYTVVKGTAEGYRITVTPDSTLYSPLETAQITSQVQNITEDYIVTNITTIIYYPNGTQAQTNTTETNATGQATINYTIPALKGSYTVITNTTVNGIPRRENTTFNVGDLTVHITTEKTVYNTLENVTFTVNITESGNLTGAGATITVYDSNSVNVYEQNSNSTQTWTQTTNSDFNLSTTENITIQNNNATLSTVNGNYTLSGSLVSSIYDGGRSINWGTIQWNATTPAPTNLTLSTRTSQDNTTWTGWTSQTNGADITNNSRYIQYRANLSTTDNTTTPVLEDVTIENARLLNFTYTLPNSPLGNYTIEVSASKTGNAGYTTKTFEVDLFDLNTTTDRQVHDSGENITVTGHTSYRGSNANASVNLTVKKNYAFNPSFETDLDRDSVPDGWSPAWEGVMTQDTVARTGTYSVKVWRAPSNTTEGLWYYPNMHTINQNTHYTFTAWAKTDNTTGGNVRLWTVWYNGASSISTATNKQKSLRSSDGWVKIQESATSPAGADNVRVHLVSDIVGSVWFDDVNIEPENNHAIYTADTTSNTTYNFTFPLTNSSSYIVYSNGSHTANATLTRSNTTIFTVRSLDVNTSTGGPFEAGTGSVTISGYVVDNRTKNLASNANVYINITYPDSTTGNYTNTTNATGYYTYSITTPTLSGTYLVNVTAKDYQNVTGITNTTFRVRLNTSARTNKTIYNPDETSMITINVNNNSAGITGATVNLTITNPSSTTKNYSTLYGNITDHSDGTYTANYSNTNVLGNYTVNTTSSVDNGANDGSYNLTFMVDQINISIVDPGTVEVGSSKTISGNVSSAMRSVAFDGTVTANFTHPNGTSVEYYNSSTAPDEYSFNLSFPKSGNYTINITAIDSSDITGQATQLNISVGLQVSNQLSQTSYDPGDNITVYVRAYNGTDYETDAQITSQLIYVTNGSIIDTNVTTTNSTGFARVNFTLLTGYTSYYINSTAIKNGINGSASTLLPTSNLRIWTDKGEALIGDTTWPSDSAPEQYRNITIKVAALDSGGLRRTGQNLTINVYYPNDTLYGNYQLNESDKIYSTTLLLPGKDIPDGKYSLEVAEYPGVKSNFSVMVWGCAKCHKENDISQGTHFSSPEHDAGPEMAPSNFSLNHSHKTVSNNCGWHSNGASASCKGCHRNETGSTSGPQRCTTCHNSASTDKSYLDDSYGADLHANINTTTGGQWYGQDTACQSCHGNITGPPSVPECTDCHPGSSGSGMINIPGSLSGSNTTLEDFEDVSDVNATSGYSYSSVSLSTNTTNVSGTYSGQVDYTFGPSYGRVYIDKKNLDLTNATKISIWMYGDNSNITFYLGINNTKSVNTHWHMSDAMNINWTGWRKISVNIDELSQSNQMYISFADTMRVKLERDNSSDGDPGASGVILLDDLKKEKVGSHSQFAEIECGLCHGGRHNLQRPPDCEGCHQSEGHGWPQLDKYPQDNATCMDCHETGVSENLLNISNLTEHTDVLEDFENNTVFIINLTNFNQSQNYYNGTNSDAGNHSAVLNYTNLTGYKGNWVNATNASRYKGITINVNATNDPNTQLVLGVYTTAWYNYSIPLDWTGWNQINIIYHNNTVNETASFNATGTPAKIWLGVYGNNSTGSVYFDNFRQAVDDFYHQYEDWTCGDCHTQIKNLPGITDITTPITECSTCHDRSEPHTKNFEKICTDCHFDSGHGEVDASFTEYEKVSTCLKCHGAPHNFTQLHLTTSTCNACHQQRIHGQNSQSVLYNESQHLDCERCHGKVTGTTPLPLSEGNPASIFLRLSYTYDNETECTFCHQNKINAYKIHTNNTVNETNQTLVDSIQNSTICTTCHDTKSVTNSSDRDELTVDDSLREPHPIQIAGHGNTSCYTCHGHRPETLILNVGDDCVGCHQDTSELTELIPGRLANSTLTNVTNPGASQLIVTPPQTTGHGNASCDNCHGHKGAGLTYVGNNASSCTQCHQNTSKTVTLLEYRQPNSSNTNVTNPGDNQLIVHPPQVVGHGNTSCTECHDHAPSTFKGYDMVGGTDCTACHQNASVNVTLIENTIRDSNNTEVVDNSTSTWIVHAPQVAGHGQTDCAECHSHSAQSLTYYGSNNTDCITCHYNASAENHLLLNGTSVKPPQIIPHGDLNCTECHGHTPESMTNTKNCNICHQNTTKAQSLTDTYAAGLNITTPEGNISAVQIPPINHSDSTIAGQKWNKTTAYWTNDTTACNYCHNISGSYSNHNPLGKSAVIQGNNTKNSSLTGSYWCAACHYQNYTHGNATYNDTVQVYLEAGLSVPPEITGNATYGNYTTANDGTGYYNHQLSNYSDDTCVSCHGTANNTKDFMHDVKIGGGGPDCASCHDLGGSAPKINITAMKLGVHANLNNNATNTTELTDLIDKACWACHGNGSEPDTHLNNLTAAKQCETCHTGTQLFNATNVSKHRQNGEVNTTAACTDCHNKSLAPFYNNTLTADFSNLYNTSHYANTSNLPNTTYDNSQGCVYCHITNTSWGGATNITTTTYPRNHSEQNNSECFGCHIDGNITVTSFHNDSLNPGWDPQCTGCHYDYDYMSNKNTNITGYMNATDANRKYVNESMYNAAVHSSLNCTDCHTAGNRSQHPPEQYTWKWCEDCHSYQEDPVNETDRHNVTANPRNITINGINPVTTKDCTNCHDAANYNNTRNNYNSTADVNCRYCHILPDEVFE